MVEGTPPGDALPPTTQRATPARKGARCGAVAGSPRPHPPHPGHTGRGTLAARSRGRAAGGGTAPDSRPPPQRWQAVPPGTASHHPRGTQPPQGMQAKGKVLGPHTHTPAPTARGWWTPTARSVGGQSGEGQRLISDAPHNGGRHPPPGDTFPPSPQRATPARKGARCGASAGSQSRHRPHPGHTGRGTLAGRSRGRAAGGGTAPDTRRPSQWWKASPLGTPFRQPHSEQHHTARAHTVGPVLGPHARTNRTRDTRVAEPWLPAPEDGRPGEGQPLTPDAPHNGVRPPPRGRPPTTPAARSPHRACRPRGQCWAPTPTHPRPQHVGGGPEQPAQWGGSRGRDSA